VSQPKIFKYENRLAGVVVTRGGLSARQAVAAAEAAVGDLREAALADIDARLGEIYAAGEQLRAGSDPQLMAAVYQASNRVLATAGVFGLEELGRACHSLCELISRFEATGRFSGPMVTVHLDGLRLLRCPDDHPAERRREILAGLSQITAAVR
jgi:hypothetical protein